MKRLITFTDGGSRNNPGPAACGIVIKDEEENLIDAFSEFLGTATNNEAEYGALIFALKKAKTFLAEGGELTCYLDSELVVKQLKGEYRVKDEKMKALHARVTALKRDFDKVEFIHVKREKNKLADELVNKELDSRGY